VRAATVPPVIPVVVPCWQIWREPRGCTGVAGELARNYAAAQRSPGWRPAPVTIRHGGYALGGHVARLAAYGGALYADVDDLPSRVGALLNGRYYSGWSICIDTAERVIDGYSWRCSTLGHLALLLPGEVPAVKGMPWPTARFRNGMIVPPST
jgi:hypothetical protein